MRISSCRSPTASRCRSSTRSRRTPTRFRGVRVHQMHALHDRPYLHGACRDHLLHVSYFLSPVTRPAFHERGCELVPNHFSEVPRLLRETTRCSLVLAAASPMDRHGYFSLGTNCDYVAPFIGRAPFFLEVNARMPRTFGRNQIHVSQVDGLDRGRPAARRGAAVPSRPTIDARIAAHVAERIPNGATIQAGIGSIPSALLGRSAPTTATSVCTPSCCPTRSSTSSRAVWSPAPASGWRRARSSPRSRSGPSSSTTSSTRTRRSSSCPSTTSTTRG